MAILVTEVKTGAVLAYVGNVTNSTEAADVDNIQSLRSYGSLLKPLLYAAALHEGILLPDMLLPDVPMQIAGYQPENYYRNYDGAVPASEALYRSLNVPAVWLQRQYSTQNFLQLIKKCHLTTFNKTAQHYGLSLVLGGAEATLWELTQLYNRMAQQLNGNLFHQALHYETAQQSKMDTLPISKAAIWYTAKALTQSHRPDEWDFWKNFSTTQKIAWKTGTSFGLRDAWAIGFNAEYAVGVWVGNSSGIGRPNLVGIQVAAPILFQVFDNLPTAKKWFQKPNMPQMAICTQSGHKAGEHCPQLFQNMPNFAEKTEICPYHQLVYTNTDSSFLLNSSCASSSEMTAKKWFVLPILQSYYYRQKHPNYRSLPPLAPQCQATMRNPIAIIYPLPNTVVYLPQLAPNEYSELVLKATHTDSKATLFWHVNDTFLGKTTENKHTQVVSLSTGDYQLTLIDEQGNMQSQKIRVRRKK
jgi:penicillin-binding protein 1C